MGAGHDHHHHGGGNHAGRIGITLALVCAYLVAEVVGGLLSNSLALLADAGHMLSDAAALVVALYAMRVARRPPSATHTFGYQRAEILAALANGAALLAISGFIAYEAISRVGSPPHVDGPLMLGVAAGGLVINLIGLGVLHGGKSDSLNVRGAWLHVLTDALGSVGAIVSGMAVTWLGWRWADPVASLIIVVLVVYSAWSLLRHTTAVLMQAVPEGMTLADVERSLVAIDGVRGAHDLHLWAVTPGNPVMSVHLSIEPGVDQTSLVQTIQRRMRDEFDVHHSTIQLNCPDECEPCQPSQLPLAKPAT